MVFYTKKWKRAVAAVVTVAFLALQTSPALAAVIKPEAQNATRNTEDGARITVQSVGIDELAEHVRLQTQAPAEEEAQGEEAEGDEDSTPPSAPPQSPTLPASVSVTVTLPQSGPAQPATPSGNSTSLDSSSMAPDSSIAPDSSVAPDSSMAPDSSIAPDSSVAPDSSIAPDSSMAPNSEVDPGDVTRSVPVPNKSADAAAATETLSVPVATEDWQLGTPTVYAVGIEYVYTLNRDAFLTKLTETLEAEGYALPAGFALPETMPTVTVMVGEGLATLENTREIVMPQVWDESYLALNGLAVTVQADAEGTDPDKTIVYYMDDEVAQYLQIPSGISTDTLEPVEVTQHLSLASDFSDYIIFGGGAAGVALSDESTSPSATVQSTSITMKSGTLSEIYGGGYATGADNSSTVTADANIVVQGGEVGYIQGDGWAEDNGATAVRGTVRITMTGGTVEDGLYGGGYAYDGGSITTGATNVEITGGTAWRVYGGGLGDETVVEGEARVLIGTNATVSGSVYGGGDGGTVGSTSVTVNTGAVIGDSVFGGGSSGIVEQNTSVTVTGGSIGGKITNSDGSYFYGYGNVFGGGENNLVRGNTKVTISGDARIAGNVFGGIYVNQGGGDGEFYSIGSRGISVESNTGNTVNGNTEVVILGGTIGRVDGDETQTYFLGSGERGDGSLLVGNVFGGGYGDIIRGSTSVTISGGSVGSGERTISLGWDGWSDWNAAGIPLPSAVHAGNVYGGSYMPRSGGAPRGIGGDDGSTAYVGSIGGSTDVKVSGGSIGYEKLIFQWPTGWDGGGASRSTGGGFEEALNTSVSSSLYSLGNVFGAGISDAVAQNTAVNISGGAFVKTELAGSYTQPSEPSRAISSDLINITFSPQEDVLLMRNAVFGGGSANVSTDLVAQPSLVGFSRTLEGVEVPVASAQLTSPAAGNTLVTLSGGANIPGDVYGGSFNSFKLLNMLGEMNVIASNTEVVMRAGTVAGSVYGGGSGMGLQGYHPVAYGEESETLQFNSIGSGLGTSVRLFGGNVRGNVVGSGSFIESESEGFAIPLTTFISGNVFVFVEESVDLVGNVYRQSIQSINERFSADTVEALDLDSVPEHPVTVAGLATVVLENKTTKVAASQFSNTAEGTVDTLQTSEPNIHAAIQNLLRLEQRSGWTLARGHWVIRGDVHLPSDVTAAISIVPTQELYMPDDTNLVAAGNFVNQGYIITAKPSLDASIESNGVNSQTNVSSRIYRGGLTGSMGIDGARNYTQNEVANALTVSTAANTLYSFLAEGGKVAANGGYNWAQGGTALGETGESYTPSTATVGTFGYTTASTWQHRFESVPGGASNNTGGGLTYLANVPVEAAASIEVTAPAASSSESSSSGSTGGGDTGGGGTGGGTTGGGDTGGGTTGGGGTGGVDDPEDDEEDEEEDEGEGGGTAPSQSQSQSQSSSSSAGGTGGTGGTGGGDVPSPPQIGEDGSVTLFPINPDSSVENVYVDGVELDPSQYTIDENGNIILSPDFLATLGDGEHTIGIRTGGELYEANVIMQNGVPLSAGDFARIGNAWSLFDLLMTVLALLSPIVYLIIVRKQKQDEEEEGSEEASTTKGRKLTVVAGVLFGIISLVLLLITQDFSQPMTFFDQYSIWFALIFVVQTVVEVVFRRKKIDDDEQHAQHAAG